MFGLLFVVALAVCWRLAGSAFTTRALVVQDYNAFRCETAGSGSAPVLRILDAVYIEELELLGAWCQSSDIAGHFSGLTARSVHRDHIDLRELYEQRYDLVLAKQELIQSISQVGQGGVAYMQLGTYPDYGSQLVSLKGTPELNEAWLAGKRLGLLDDPNSVSAYQIPRAALQSSGLLQVPEIIYFRSYRQMYRALFAGEVDVIATFLSEEGPDSRLQLPPGLVLGEAAPGPAWYIGQDLLDTPVHCVLQAALLQLAASFPADYFRDFQVVRPCRDR